MISLFNTWQFNLIVCLISFVIFVQFYKLAVRNAKNDGAATVLLQLIAGISIIILIPLLPFKISSDPKVYLLLLIASVFYALNDRLQTTVRKHLQVSIVTIIFRLSTVFLILIGLLVFKESTTVLKLSGTGLILLANVLIFYKKGSFKLNKYVWLAILATLTTALAVSIDISNSKKFNLAFYIMFTFLLPAIMVFLANKINFSQLKKEFNVKEKKYYLITGIFWSLGVFFSLRSFQLGKITTIAPLQATVVLFNVIVAYFLLGEKKDELKKIAAAILVIVGVYLTVVN